MRPTQVLRKRLEQACAGRLRRHTAKHVAKVGAIQRRVLCQALLIALATNVLPAVRVNPLLKHPC